MRRLISFISGPIALVFIVASAILASPTYLAASAAVLSIRSINGRSTRAHRIAATGATILDVMVLTGMGSATEIADAFGESDADGKWFHELDHFRRRSQLFRYLHPLVFDALALLVSTFVFGSTVIESGRASWMLGGLAFGFAVAAMWPVLIASKRYMTHVGL